MAKISIIEDEENIADLLKMNLELEGHETKVYQRGDEALSNLSQLHQSDLLIVDWMLPGNSGIDIIQKVRQTSTVPMLMLSAKGNTSERIEGLKAGANDYLPKPFDLEELLLRVNNLLPVGEVSTFSIGDLRIDPVSFECQNKTGTVVHQFSKREIELLALFHEKEGQVVSRDEILDKIWGTEQFPTSRTIDNYILTFRKIFESNPREPRYFHSIRGVGYKFTP